MFRQWLVTHLPIPEPDALGVPGFKIPDGVMAKQCFISYSAMMEYLKQNGFTKYNSKSQPHAEYTNPHSGQIATVAFSYIDRQHYVNLGYSEAMLKAMQATDLAEVL